MIMLKKGNMISHVVVSSILGHSGRGMFPLTLKLSYRKFVKKVLETKTTVIAESATRFKIVGNYQIRKPWTWWIYVRKLPRMSLLNAFGLTNDGIEKCAKKILRSAKKGFQVIPSYFPEFSKGLDIAIKEALEAIAIYQSELGDYFFALEINVSCPNAGEDVSKNMSQAVACAKAIKARHPDLTLIVKLSYLHPISLAEELERVGVNIIHGINTIPYGEVFPNKQSPLHKVGGGGISGGLAYPQALEYNTKLSKRVSIPLIMGCGITDLISLGEYKDIRGNGNSVSICSLVRLNPTKAIMAIEISN